MSKQKQVGVYLDGCNLYRGMLAAGFRKFFWLDLYSLAESLCPLDSQILSVKYFTARKLNLKKKGTTERADEERSRKRQSDYIEAVILRGVEVYEGKFKKRHVQCRDCGKKWVKPEEKMTDVLVATHLLCDAFRKRIDAAIVVSGDADLVPPIKVLVNELRLTVVVAFPPKRMLKELKDAASSAIHINKRHLAINQFPDSFVHDGYTYSRPAEWQ